MTFKYLYRVLVATLIFGWTLQLYILVSMVSFSVSRYYLPAFVMLLLGIVTTFLMERVYYFYNRIRFEVME